MYEYSDWYLQNYYEGTTLTFAKKDATTIFPQKLIIFLRNFNTEALIGSVE